MMDENEGRVDPEMTGVFGLGVINVVMISTPVLGDPHF